MQFPTVGNYNISNCMFYIMSSHSMEFEYLNDVPVMTLDVNEDFKGDKIKCANMIEKVGTVSACVKIRNHQLMLSLLFIYCISMYVFARFNKSLHLPHFPSKMEMSNECHHKFVSNLLACCYKRRQFGQNAAWDWVSCDSGLSDAIKCLSTGIGTFTRVNTHCACSWTSFMLMLSAVVNSGTYFHIRHKKPCSTHSLVLLHKPNCYPRRGGEKKSKVMICAFVGLDFNANLTPFLFFAFL